VKLTGEGVLYVSLGLNVLMVVLFICEGNYKKAVYFLGAALINGAVISMR